MAVGIGWLHIWVLYVIIPMLVLAIRSLSDADDRTYEYSNRFVRFVKCAFVCSITYMLVQCYMWILHKFERAWQRSTHDLERTMSWE